MKNINSHKVDLLFSTCSR